MKFKQLLNEESTRYDVRIIKLSNMDAVQAFADFYNKAGELTWQLTPSRLKQKIGSKGKLWGLFVSGTDELVGTVGLKEIVTHNEMKDNFDMGEIGYLMISPEHRSLPNVMKLYKVVLAKARQFDAAYITTNIKNKTINKLLDRTPKVTKVLTIKSPFGGGQNKLFVYMVNTSKAQNRLEIISDFFASNIISTEE